MQNQEIHERYQRARALADGELMLFMCAENMADDVIDAMETVMLWRMATEGQSFSPMCWAQMMEATDQ